jgi:Tol biopolymer transport system component/predicted Ser/Thr protein kinase
MIGKVVSHYNILEKLGEGGMGVVYKALDTELDRVVALKFLPHAITPDESEQARFMQEAKAASALNHPSICAIHSLGEYEGQRFIDMEFVDGETLRRRIEKGGLGSGEAIDFAIQICEALQEAHSKGIIHRDVKSDNIMVTTKNQIKVMDFGLAKLKGSLKLTKTTSTIGTLAYMAPEQIEHETVDARSDLFSMGVVLYEMLTGHLPFRGEHEAAMMYSIINEEPEPLQHYLPDVPSELVHIVNRALDKDPEDRYQSAHDMVIDLRRLKKQSTKVIRREGPLPAPHPAEAVPEVVPRSRRRLWIPLGASLVVIAAAIIVVLLPRGQQLNPDMKFRIIQAPMRNIWYGDLSADGNWLVFSASDEGGKFDVYMMNVAGGQPRRVTTDTAAYINGVSLSPDGSTILFASSTEQRRSFRIMSVPSVGGVSREVIESGLVPGWRPDGQKIAYVISKELPRSRSATELWTARPDGTDRKCEISDTSIYRTGIRFSFSFSPDWKSVAWTRNYPEGYSEIVVHDMESGHERQLTYDKKFADDALWLPNGHIVLSSTRGGNANLWVVPASGGELVQLTKGSGPDAPIGFSRALNRLVYIEMQQTGQIKVANLETHSTQQLTVEDRLRGFPSISGTGRYVVYPEEDADALSMSRNLRFADREGTTRKLTDDGEFRVDPAVSPDGEWVLDVSRLPTEPAESTRVFLLSVSNPGHRKFLGHGYTAQWINEKEFFIWNFSAGFRGSIEREGCERVGPDSVAALPVSGGLYVVNYDERAKSRGLWITTVPKGASQKVGVPRQLLKSPPFWMAFASGTRELFYQLGMMSEVRRMSLPSGKDIPLGLKLPGTVMGFCVRPDGKEMVYQEIAIKSRYVAIEHVFK